MTMQPPRKKVEDDPDYELRTFREQLPALRHALEVEVARSDFLWDRALARQLVTEEEYAMSQEPWKLLQLERARAGDRPNTDSMASSAQ